MGFFSARKVNKEINKKILEIFVNFKNL